MSEAKIQSWLAAAKTSFDPDLYRRSTDFQRCCTFWEAVGDCDIPQGFEHTAMAVEFEADMKKFTNPRPSSAVLKRLIGAWSRKFTEMNESAAVSGDGLGSSEPDVGNPSTSDNNYEGLGGSGVNAATDATGVPKSGPVDENGLYRNTIRAMVETNDDEADGPHRPPKRQRDNDFTRADGDELQSGMLQGSEANDTTPLRPDPVHSKTWTEIESSDLFKRLKSTIVQLLEMLIDQGEDYWSRFHPDQELWKDTDPAVKEHVSSLKLPEVPLRSQPSLPDLLLYGLGGLDVLDDQHNARLRAILANGLDCYFVNAGGVGKTRMLFECLYRVWGLFFNCYHDVGSNPYGSRDLSTAKAVLNHSRLSFNGKLVNFQAHVSSSDPNAAAIRQCNLTMAERVYRTLYLARMLVFDWFLTAWTSRKGCRPNQDTMRLWCMLQIRPHLDNNFDVFDEVFRAMIDLDANSALLKAKSIAAAPWRIPFELLVFDEVHVPATEFVSAFQAANSAKPRPLLKPLIGIISDIAPLAKVYVAATYFNEELIKEALGSTLLKNSREPPTAFTDFGQVNDMASILSTMTHFLSAETVRRISQADLAEIKYWIPGRHRFLADFIQWVLQQGAEPQCMMNVLRRLVQGSTGTSWAGIPREISGFSRMNLIPAPLRAKILTRDLVSVHQDICQTVVCFVMNGQTPCWPEGKLKHVTLGIGRVVTTADGRTHVTIDEHLVLAALMHWLDQNLGQFIAGLDRLMADTHESSRGLAYEDVYTYLIWNAFVDEGRPLNEVFDFIYLEPAWASEKAQLIDVFSSHSTDNQAHTLERSATTQIGMKTKTAEATREWFAGRTDRIPLLQPDEFFGPDVVNGLLLSGGREVLFLHQLKYWNSHKSSDKFREAVYKLSPEGLYKSCRHEFTALKTHLGHFKARPDLPMPPPHPDESTHKTYKYRTSLPEYSLIRVFGAFKGTYQCPKLDQSLGRYRIAVPAAGLIGDGLLRFPAFRRAVENAARVESERKPKNKKKT